MPLRTLLVRPSYRTDEADIAADFFVPCLRNAYRYDRATGYFTSGVLSRLVVGLEPFAQAGGKIRLVASPVLTTDDIDQVTKGYVDRDFVVKLRIGSQLDELSATDPGAYGRLAWLVANEILDVRLAFPRRTGSAGVYHEKFGLFSDNIDSIAFTGSLNETLAAFDNNFEYIDVFTSWADRLRVDEKAEYFERLWQSQTPRLEVLTFPAALRERLLTHAPSAYPAATKVFSESPTTVGRSLRPHQAAAIEAWRGNGSRGLLEMATGTGKTFTALTEIASMVDSQLVKTVLVLVPYIAIAEQWKNEIETILGISPIVCHSMSGDWKVRLRTQVVLSRLQEQQLVVLALYDTASSEEFQSQAERFPGPIVLVADEVHNVTIDSASAVLLDRYDYRLGLSATPERYLDDVGTERIAAYFGGTVFKYSLGDAIRADILTPYEYIPTICGSSDDGGFLNLSGVNAAKFSRFCAIFMSTPAAVEGFALVYCQPAQLAETKLWLGITSNKRIHTFTAEEDLDQRKQILRDFGSGFYHALVAMRCLDEGVDVPPTRSAFLLGSSENPKQFIQRRGRVLRKYPGKSKATIYDFIFLPDGVLTATREAQLRKEVTRFAEFAMSAINRDEAVSIISRAASSRGICIDEYILREA